VNTRARWTVSILVVGAALLALAKADNLIFGAAVANAEHRPALLRNAEWKKPAPVFGRRFHKGVPESELLSWLRANQFVIERATRVATRRIQSLPCNERVEIKWSTSGEGLLQGADARVSEAGCL